MHASVLLNMSLETARKRRFVHQTWAREETREEYRLPPRNYCATWVFHHPDHTHVLWNAADNDRLVREHYSDLFYAYQRLPLLINKLDMVRLLYLHRYGGLYVDIDYECRGNVASSIRGVSLVASPLPLETVQNSLMACDEPGNAFWICAARQLCETYTALVSTRLGEPGYAGSVYFQHVLTRHIAQVALTSFITGSGNLDRLLALGEWTNDVTRLSIDEYYRGHLSYHHEHASWGWSWKSVTAWLAAVLSGVFSRLRGRMWDEATRLRGVHRYGGWAVFFSWRGVPIALPWNSHNSLPTAKKLTEEISLRGAPQRRGARPAPLYGTVGGIGCKSG